MSLRSEPVIIVESALASAAEKGKGLLIGDIKKLIPKARNPFGVIWEMRRHGAETIAVREGRQIVGWLLKSRLPVDKNGDIHRADRPTEQAYIEYDPSLFRSKLTGNVAPFKKPKKKTMLYSPVKVGPLTPIGKALSRKIHQSVA